LKVAKTMNENKINSVLALSSQERCDYLLRKVADFETIYLIKDSADKTVTTGAKDEYVIPVWPEKEFAERLVTGDWKEYQVEECDIHDFVDWLAELAKQGAHIDVFPDHQFSRKSSSR